MRREPLRRDPMRRLPMRREPLRRDPMRRLSMRREPLRRDPMRRDPISMIELLYREIIIQCIVWDLKEIFILFCFIGGIIFEKCT